MVQDSEVLKTFSEGSKVVREMEGYIVLITELPLTAVKEVVQRGANDQHKGNRYLAAVNWLNLLLNADDKTNKQHVKQKLIGAFGTPEAVDAYLKKHDIAD